MKSSHSAELEDKQAVVSEFLHSDTQKIFMVIGSTPSSLSEFIDRSTAMAARDMQNRIFRYEFRDGEHSRHFLFRWLWDTVSGAAYCGSGSWSDIAEADPQLIHKLHLLAEKDVRPLEVRFMEAIRFIAANLTPGRRILLCFIPVTPLRDKLLVEFFQAVLRVLPLNIKLLIGQGNEDVLAAQADFCPSNRLILTVADEKHESDIAQRYRACIESGLLAGRLLQTLLNMALPVGLDLLARITGESEDAIDLILRSEQMEDLIEFFSDKTVRLKHPHAFAAANNGIAQWEVLSVLDAQVLDHYLDRLTRGGAGYQDVLGHSLYLQRVEDAEIVYSHVRDTCMPKLSLGGGDLCELEISRGLSLLKQDQTGPRAALLLRLGEVREARQRNPEAIEALDPAIEHLKSSANLEDLQLALELKGRAAFAIRDTAASKTAFDESLRIARQLGRDNLTAATLSQIGYLHFSIKQLAEAETFYREALELYSKIAEAGGEEGRKGIASQWSNLGHTSYAKGDFETAEAQHRKALEEYESLGEVQSSANQWGFLGHTFFAAHSYEKAVQAYERAAELEEKQGKPEKAAQRYAGIGHSMYAQRKADLARRSFQKALEKYTQLGNPEGRAAQLSNLGLVEGDQGEYEAAAGYFNQAARLYREIGDPIGETTQITHLAHLLQAQKRYDEAIEQYESALKRYREIEYPMGEGDVLTEMGRLYTDRKEWRKAGQCFDGARAIFAKMGRREKEALCHMLVAYAEKGRGDSDAAMAAMQQAMDIYKQDNNSLGVANVVSQMGLLHYEQQHFEDAERLYRDALDEFRKREDTEGEANLLCNLGTLYYQTEKLNQARQYYQDALTLLRKLDHPAGIAGLLMNLSFVSEQEGKLDEAASQLQEAKQIYVHLDVSYQSTEIDRRLAVLDEKAVKSLEQMRSEFSASHFKAGPQNKSGGKVGPNAPCPCGSGKKYKKCCAH